MEFLSDVVSRMKDVQSFLRFANAQTTQYYDTLNISWMQEFSFRVEFQRNLLLRHLREFPQGHDILQGGYSLKRLKSIFLPYPAL